MSLKNSPTRCGVCQELFPNRSEMCKHKHVAHNINFQTTTKTTKRTCRTCLDIFSSHTELLSHQLTVHREKFFPNGMKSGPKKGTKFKLDHRHKISKALRIFYGTYDESRPLGPSQIHSPNSIHERWCYDYEVWRTQVLERDNHTCLHCGENDSSKLVAHHIKPYRFFISSRYVVSNGATLCGTCHRKEEAKLRKIRTDSRLFLHQLVLLQKNLQPEKLFGSVGKVVFRQVLQTEEQKEIALQSWFPHDIKPSSVSVKVV